MHKEKLETPELVVDDDGGTVAPNVVSADSTGEDVSTSCTSVGRPTPKRAEDRDGDGVAASCTSHRNPTPHSGSGTAPASTNAGDTGSRKKPFWKTSRQRKPRTMEQRKSDVIFGIALTTFFSIAGLYLTREGTTGHILMTAGASAAAFFGTFCLIHLTNPRWYQKIPFDHSVTDIKAYAIWKSFSVLGLMVTMVTLIFSTLNLNPNMFYHFRIGVPLVAFESLFDYQSAILHANTLYHNAALNGHKKSAFAYRSALLKNVHKLQMPPSSAPLSAEPITPPNSPREAGLRALLHWEQLKNASTSALIWSELHLELEQQGRLVSPRISFEAFTTKGGSMVVVNTKALKRTLATLPSKEAAALRARLHPINSRGVSIIDMRSRYFSLTDAPKSDTHLVDARQLLAKLKARTGPLPAPLHGWQTFRDSPDVNSQVELGNTIAFPEPEGGGPSIDNVFPHFQRPKSLASQIDADGKVTELPGSFMPIDYAVVSTKQLKLLEKL